jgi:hypothetical protein
VSTVTITSRRRAAVATDAACLPDSFNDPADARAAQGLASHLGRTWVFNDLRRR